MLLWLWKYMWKGNKATTHFSDVSSSGGAVHSVPVKIAPAPGFCSGACSFLRDLTCFSGEGNDCQWQRTQPHSQSLRHRAVSAEIWKAVSGRHEFHGLESNLLKGTNITSQLYLWSTSGSYTGWCHGSKVSSPSTRSGIQGLWVGWRVGREGFAPPPQAAISLLDLELNRKKIIWFSEREFVMLNSLFMVDKGFYPTWIALLLTLKLI